VARVVVFRPHLQHLGEGRSSLIVPAQPHQRLAEEEIRGGGAGIGPDRQAARGDRLLVPLVDVKGHGEAEGRDMVGGIDVEGLAALGGGFHPAAGVRQGAHQTMPAGAAAGGQLDCPSEGDEGLVALAGGEQDDAKTFLDPGVVRPQREGGPVVGDRVASPAGPEQRGRHLAVEPEVARLLATRLGK
jgi:hypothetical protein